MAPRNAKKPTIATAIATTTETGVGEPAAINEAIPERAGTPIVAATRGRLPIRSRVVLVAHKRRLPL